MIDPEEVGGLVKAPSGPRRRRTPPKAAACAGKAAYPSWSAAAAVAGNGRSRLGGKARAIGAYRCAHCHAWHVGATR